MGTKRSSQNNLVIVVVGLWIGVGFGILAILGLRAIGIVTLDPGASMLNLAQIDNQPVVPRVDSPAPEFVLQDLSGTEVNLSNYHGRAVVVNFWATWCGPCVREMPMFQKYQDWHEEDLVILAVNYQETIEEVKPFIDTLSLTYEILMDVDGEAYSTYQVRALPTTFIIDTDGVIRYQHIGVMNEEQFSGYLRQVGVGE